jgi:hypothetical protein
MSTDIDLEAQQVPYTRAGTLSPLSYHGPFVLKVIDRVEEVARAVGRSEMHETAMIL